MKVERHPKADGIVYAVRFSLADFEPDDHKVLDGEAEAVAVAYWPEARVAKIEETDGGIFYVHVAAIRVRAVSLADIQAAQKAAREAEAALAIERMVAEDDPERAGEDLSDEEEH